MPSGPLVSIITPTFNHADFIATCIESVLHQTYPHWELLIVNDGSDDSTASIAGRYAEQDERIHLFNRDNIGVFRLAETYNYALSQARGEFVGILEGDDLWMPEKLRLQIEALSTHPDAVMGWSRAMIVDDALGQIRLEDKSIDRIPSEWSTNMPVGSALNGLYLSNFIPAASIIIRTETLREVGGFQQREGLPLVDYPTLLSIAAKGRFVFVDEALAKWRWHPNQVTRLFHTNIIERVRDTALAHQADLANPIREVVSVTPEDIKKHYRAEIHRAYVQSGRYKLVEKRYAEARRDFRNAFCYFGPVRMAFRLQALAGIGSSILKKDLEWIARLLGKTDLSWRQVPEKDAETRHEVSR